nr:hypothetical protein [Novosphingobium profundi]
MLLDAAALGLNVNVFAHIKLTNQHEETPEDHRVLLHERRQRLYAANSSFALKCVKDTRALPI